MEKKDEEAFLKSVFGTTPIKKNNLVKKNISRKPTNYKSQKPNKAKPHTDSTSIKKSSEKNLKLEKISIGKKIKQKKILIDEKIDLHGYSLIEAETIFIEKIKSCYKRDLRCLLFITGKGILKKNQTDADTTRLYYGKIRNNFVLWTNKKSLSQYILGVEQATIEYGADGAFFVYLRKQKY